MVVVRSVSREAQSPQGFPVDKLAADRWCRITLEGSSRFVLASELSKRREINDARHAFAKGKENANGTLPSYVVTDCLNSYKKAFIEEFNSRASIHVKTKSLSEGFE
ncbi:MAG: hypothetical protein ACRD5H_11880, partial [Nitrososphaerales archaeon]